MKYSHIYTFERSKDIKRENEICAYEIAIDVQYNSACVLDILCMNIRKVS